MSFRDALQYFAAHAPAKPAEWFEPVMPPQPVIPSIPLGWSRQQVEQWDGLGDYFDLSDVDAAVSEYADAHEKACDDLASWRRDHAIQLTAQWPRAWAETVLADLERAS